MLKTALIISTISLAVSGLIYAIQNPVLSTKTGLQIQVTPGNNFVSDKPFVEQFNQDSPSGLTLASADTLIEENLTESFTNNLADKLVQANPGGIQIQNGEKSIAVPDPEQIAIDLLAEAQKKFDGQNLVPEIKTSDFKIIKNDMNAIIVYAQKFDEISAKTEVLEIKNAEELGDKLSVLTKSYQESIKEFYQLPVPELMVGIHKTKIAYLSAELELLKMMNGAEQDPMAAILAGRNLLELEKEFYEKLQNEELKILELFRPKQ